MQNGSLANTGVSTLLVTQSSAGRIGLPENFYEHLPLNTDHRSLVRYEDANDLNYEQVKTRIKTLVKTAPHVVRGRFAVEGGS